MWEINSNLQIMGFLYSVALGGIFSLIYDIFKIFRLSFKIPGFIIFLGDILYFSVIAFLAFCFHLSTTGGEIRFYILLGCVIGFFFIRATLSKITVPVMTFVLKKLSRLFNFINSNILRFFDAISHLLGGFFKNISSFFKNNKNTLKKLLKKGKGLLYTKQE